MTMAIPSQNSPYLSDEYLDMRNSAVLPHTNVLSYLYSSRFIISIGIIIFIFCVLGLLANGTVTWILGFHMKRNYFTIYTINLAIADLGLLIMQMLKVLSMLLILLNKTSLYFSSFIHLFYFIMYNTSQLLLITIGIDRCVAIFFPIWHQCYQPPKLSKVICAILWVFSFTLFGTQCLGVLLYPTLLYHAIFFQLILNGLICYPVMIIFTLTLLVTIYLKKHQQTERRVLIATLLELLCFLVFRFPPSLLSVIVFVLLKDLIPEKNSNDSNLHLPIVDKLFSWLYLLLILSILSEVCVTINSSINPIFYFLAGRKKGKHRASIKRVLQRVFGNEDDTRETTVENHL